MKTKRILGVMLAFAASASVINSSDAEDKAVGAAVEQSVLEPNIAQSYQQLSVDVAQAKFSGKELLSRIDSLVSRIDATLKLEPENAKQLTGFRNATLQMRAKIVRFMKANGTQLVQITGPVVPNALPGQNLGVPGQPTVDALGNPIVGSPVGTGPIGGGITGGGVAGGGGLAGGAAGGAGGFAGGLGGLSGLSGLAGVAAATVAATSDDDDPGTPASPSN